MVVTDFSESSNLKEKIEFLDDLDFADFFRDKTYPWPTDSAPSKSTIFPYTHIRAAPLALCT
jgi:hypothetical protein